MNDSRKRIISQLIKSKAKASRRTAGHNMRHDPEPQTPDLLCTVNVRQITNRDYANDDGHVPGPHDHFLLQGSDS